MGDRMTWGTLNVETCNTPNQLLMALIILEIMLMAMTATMVTETVSTRADWQDCGAADIDSVYLPRI
jgi:hypothetical protein